MKQHLIKMMEYMLVAAITMVVTLSFHPSPDPVTIEKIVPVTKTELVPVPTLHSEHLEETFCMFPGDMSESANGYDCYTTLVHVTPSWVGRVTFEGDASTINPMVFPNQDREFASSNAFVAFWNSHRAAARVLDQPHVERVTRGSQLIPQSQARGA